MENYEIVNNIVIPIICSIIGGLFTFGGVYLTIRHEKKKEVEERILANKPLFWRIDPMQDYYYKSSITYALKSKEDENICDLKGYSIYGIFKNTDNSIFIIEKILINNKIYEPINGNVVDKNQIFDITIKRYEEFKVSDELILEIKDILNNKYRYKLEINEKHNIRGFMQI